MSEASRWKDIGVFLGIADGPLDTIEADHKGVMGCLRELLSLWLKQVDPPPTIKALAEAVKLINPRKAEEIEALERAN